MPRRSRINLADVPQHIMQRGNNRQAMFFAECNPVRAGMVHGPGEYPWSSYRHHAFGVADKLLAVHEQYERRATSDEERQLTYRGLFATELDEKELSEIRDTVNRGWPLGSDRFKDEIERALQCAARPPTRGRPSRKSDSMLVAKQRRPVYRAEKLH